MTPPSKLPRMHPFISPRHAQQSSTIDVDCSSRDSLAVTTQPGDVLYVPSFWLHSVRTLDSQSINLNAWSLGPVDDVWTQLRQWLANSTPQARNDLLDKSLRCARRVIADRWQITLSSSSHDDEQQYLDFFVYFFVCFICFYF